MKSRIKQITLLDGKQIFYPSEEEVKKLKSQTEDIIYEIVLTKDEWEQFMLDFCTAT